MTASARANRLSLTTRLAPIAVLGSVVAFLVLSEHSVCLFANLTGHPCPGCGLTRAALALLQGHFSRATHIHPLIWVCLPLLLALTIEGLSGLWLAKPLNLTSPSGRLGKLLNWLWVLFAVALIGVWGARMLGAFGGPVSINPMWPGLATWQPF